MHFGRIYESMLMCSLPLHLWGRRVLGSISLLKFGQSLVRNREIFIKGFGMKVHVIALCISLLIELFTS